MSNFLNNWVRMMEAKSEVINPVIDNQESVAGFESMDTVDEVLNDYVEDIKDLLDVVDETEEIDSITEEDIRAYYSNLEHIKTLETLKSRILNNGGMTRAIASDLTVAIPGFESNMSINEFTSHPSNMGLKYSIEAIDAKSAALGGLGIGLLLAMLYKAVKWVYKKITGKDTDNASTTDAVNAAVDKSEETSNVVKEQSDVASKLISDLDHMLDVAIKNTKNHDKLLKRVREFKVSLDEVPSKVLLQYYNEGWYKLTTVMVKQSSAIADYMNELMDIVEESKSYYKEILDSDDVESFDNDPKNPNKRFNEWMMRNRTKASEFNKVLDEVKEARTSLSNKADDLRKSNKDIEVDDFIKDTKSKADVLSRTFNKNTVSKITKAIGRYERVLDEFDAISSKHITKSNGTKEGLPNFPGYSEVRKALIELGKISNEFLVSSSLLSELSKETVKTLKYTVDKTIKVTTDSESGLKGLEALAKLAGDYTDDPKTKEMYEKFLTLAKKA